MVETEIKASVGDTMPVNSQMGVGHCSQLLRQRIGSVSQDRGSKLSVTVDPCIILSTDLFLF